jgi:integrase
VRHPIGSRAYLALMLLLCTGQRRSDVVRMGWQHVRNGKIAVRRQKTDTPLRIPITPELANAIALVPRTNLTFLLTEHGAPFTAAGFGDNWFRARRNEAGLPQCSAHGLRKLAATRLANAGCFGSPNHVRDRPQDGVGGLALHQGHRAGKARRTGDGAILLDKTATK